MSTFPIWPPLANGGGCSCGSITCERSGKHPVIRWGKASLAANTHIAIPHGYNAGLCTGARSGVFVVDLDNKKGKNGYISFDALCDGRPLPNTTMVQTPTGGAHLYFNNPPNVTIPKLNRGELGLGIDIQGEGAFVVIPPSIGGNGVAYTVLNQAPVADAPQWLLQEILKTHPKTSLPLDYRAVVPKKDPDEIEAGRVEYDSILTVIWGLPPGTRNNGLFQCCCQIGKIIALRRIDPLLAEKGVIARVSNWKDPEKTNDTMHRGFQLGYDSARELLEFAEVSCNDLGNAQRFIKRYGSDIRYCPTWQSSTPWLYWDGKRWAKDRKLRIQEFAKATAEAIKTEAWLYDGGSDVDVAKRKQLNAWAHQSANGQRIREMMKLGASQVPTHPNDFDTQPFLFCCQNGTLDLTTGKIRKHNPRDNISKISPVNYNPAAAHPLWDKCLDTWTQGDKELQAFLQRMAGYCLTGVQTAKAFFFIYGPPDAGKNKFLQALTYVMGDYAAMADAETWLASRFNGRGNREDLAALLGARLAYTDELPKNRKFDEVWMKRVTGGGDITCAGKYEKQVTYTPNFKIVLSANDAPIINDDDEGMWVRCKRIPFAYSIPKRQMILDLSDRLAEPDCAAAILAWAVRGCLAWQKDGLGSSTAIKWSQEQYKRDMSAVARFLEEQCDTQNPDGWINKSTLYEAFNRWRQVYSKKSPEIGLEKFANQIRKYVPDVTTGRRNNIRYWRGIQIKRDQGDDIPAVKPTRKETTNVAQFA